ncbi:MAG: peptide deformylase [Dehalococcoidia bacterium]|nr:peptide deformylase [Dehalococcoidia bacterium]
MTIRPIRYLGDPVLRRPSKRVRRVDDSIRRLIADMTESMVAAQGVGIAAPQIGVGLRIVVIGMPDDEPFALINPEVIKRSGERRLDEGCLSVPGYRGNLTRSVSVVVKALDDQGREIRIKGEDDLLAQALEHEVDHVNGTLYVDRLDSRDDLVKIEAAEPDRAQPARETADVAGEGLD